MKKLYIITAFVAILCFGLSTAMAQNNDNNNPTIVKFVKQYFPKANILTVKADWDDYEVRLSDGTQLEFTRKPEWKKIDCEHSTAYHNVPDKLIPERIANYVKSDFPDQNIIKIDKKRRGWEIELDNKLEIKFNKRFTVLDYDD